MTALPVFIVAVVAAFSSAMTLEPGRPGCDGAIVTPGHTVSNSDVGCTNNTEAPYNATATITPCLASGQQTNSTITTTNHFTGVMSGLETGDSVSLGSNNTATVSGTGGTVNIVASGSSVTVTNLAPSGGAGMVVNLPGGGTATVLPGQSQTFNT